jgi:hypothetical protein
MPTYERWLHKNLLEYLDQYYKKVCNSPSFRLPKQQEEEIMIPFPSVEKKPPTYHVYQIF